MDVAWALMWGLLGGVGVAAVELYSRTQQDPVGRLKKSLKSRLFPNGLDIFLVALALRGFLSALVVTGAAAQGPVPGPIAAIGLGAAAPVILQRLAELARQTFAATSDQTFSGAGNESSNV